jgi:hypothetical protein
MDPKFALEIRYDSNKFTKNYVFKEMWRSKKLIVKILESLKLKLPESFLMNIYW